MLQQFIELPGRKIQSHFQTAIYPDIFSIFLVSLQRTARKLNSDTLITLFQTVSFLKRKKLHHQVFLFIISKLALEENGQESSTHSLL